MTAFASQDVHLHALPDAGSHPLLHGVGVLTFDHELRYISAAGHQLLMGLSPPMLVGKTIHELFPAELATGVEPLYRSALQGHESVIDVPHEGRVYELRLAPVRDSDGVVVAGVCATLDVTRARTTQQALKEERRRAHEVETIGQVGSWELDIPTGTMTRSEMLCRLYGADLSYMSCDFQRALDLVHPDDRDQVDQAMQACMTDGTPLRVQYRLTRPDDGRERWFDARGEVTFAAGRPIRVIGVVADVTEVTAQVLADARVRATSAFEKAVISASPDIIYVYDVDTRTTVWTNRSPAELLGYTGCSSEGHDTIKSLMSDAGSAAFDLAHLAATDDPDEIPETTYRLRHADGGTRWFSQRATPLHRDERGRVTQLVGALRDVTDAMVLQDWMNHRAVHDDLTGLPNRALLVERLNAALARSCHDGGEVAVLFCDLDGFKRVNDTAGHAAGDAVLLEVTNRLHSVVRHDDTVARVGGDEFVLVVEPWDRRDTRTGHGEDAPTTCHQVRGLALVVAERVAAALRRPIVVAGVEHQISVSIGVAFAGGRVAGTLDPVRADDLLRDADAAMYRSKGGGKDRVEVFTVGMRADLVERARIEQVLRAALCDTAQASGAARCSLTAAYQPIFAHADGSLVGFEALARLTDAEGGPVAPDAFIPVAEEAGLILLLGARMLDMACRQLAAWRTGWAELSTVTMAVNMSALQAQHASLADVVHRALAAHGLAPSDLVLELTETSLLHANAATIERLQDLHDQGVGISIDDFGTGYASLRYLATLPVSSVKVDRSFTAGLPADATSRKIVGAVAGLAADMGITCVVEGVETAEQRAALPTGVQIQGWLTGAPGRAHELDVPHLTTHGIRSAALS